LGRIDAVVARANSKVFFNPKQSPAVVTSGNHVTAQVLEFHDVLGIEVGGESAEARRWREAASEHWDSARVVGVSGVHAAKVIGGETREHARSVAGRLSNRIAERKVRRDAEDQQHDDR
jgi:hypothetical protein